MTGACKRVHGFSNKILAELCPEGDKHTDIISHDAGERICNQPTGSNARHWGNSGRATLKAHRIFDDEKPANVHGCPTKRSKFWFKTDDACSAGKALRTKFTGSGSPRGNGASLPINRCSTGTTVAAYSRIFGSKQMVSK